MYRFHVCVHALPPETPEGETVFLGEFSVSTLAVAPAALNLSLGVTFEVAAESLARLPRMFFEPDGSFVWVSPSAEPAWQVEGYLFDRGGQLLYVEVKGSCPPAEFDLILRTIGWPETLLAFQLVRAAVFVSEAECRRVLELPG